MGIYYVNCNNNQSYYALLQNAILCSALTPADFEEGGLGFLSENCIFVSRQVLSPELRRVDGSSVYYPVTLLLDTGATRLTGWPVVKDSGGFVLYKTRRNLADCDRIPGFVGMFLLGGLPLSFLSGILFEREQDLQGYRKSSPDLWFPMDLLRVFPEGVEVSPLTLKDLKALSAQAKSLSNQGGKAQEALGAIDSCLRRKAALYLGLEATQGWVQGFVKTNLDANAIGWIDEKQLLKKAVKEGCKAKGIPATRIFPGKAKGEVKGEDPSEKRLVESLTAQILTFPKEERIDRQGFCKLQEACLKALPEENREGYQRGFAMIDAYCYARTEMDPDRALEALSGMGSLQALLFLIDQQDNGEFLRNATRRLGQEETRLCMALFGLLRGMEEVEGRLKGNRQLEYRLEQVTSKKGYGLVSPNIPVSHGFLAGGAKGVFGLVPTLSWCTEEDDIRRAFLQESDQVLEKFYKKFLSDTIVRPEVYAFEEPVMVERSFRNMAEVEAFWKEMKQKKEIFQGEQVRRFLRDKKAFSSLLKNKKKDILAFCKGGLK